MKVEVVRRSLVKPCTPTSPHLRSYKISAMDELSSSQHVIRLLYYQPDSSINRKQIIINLKDSLANVLSLFYPLAGRYVKEKRLVDCNDEGAEYVEARVLDCGLMQLKKGEGGAKTEHLNHLLPLNVGEMDEPNDPIFAVQINTFQCGGLVIGACASHRIFDAFSLGMFLKAWANATTLLGGGNVVEIGISPDFDSSSLFPAENMPPIRSNYSRNGDTSGIVVKRFVFDKMSISKLRDSVVGSDQWKLDLLEILICD